jgi:hypothetical protein
MKKNKKPVDAQKVKACLLAMAKRIGKRRKIGIARFFDMMVECVGQ